MNKIHNSTINIYFGHKQRHIIALAFMLNLVFSVPQVLADGAGNADVIEDAMCMQDKSGFGLNCTANDISIAGVENLTILDDGCAFPGDDVTFRADFRVLLTAQERHDAGLWFALDGDPNGDGALTGTCTTATPAYAPDTPWLDLDGTNDGGFCADGITACEVDRDCKGIGDGVCALHQDTCGDIDANHNPLFPGVTLTVKCVAGNAEGDLLVPNCTSWRQPGSNELCTSPLDAFPGAPSKCKCDNGFTVPIKVPPAVLTVTKTANPISHTEPGDTTTYTVTVTNVGIDPNNPVTLNSLIDIPYGDITTAHGAITRTDCSVPQSIPSDDGNIGGIDTYTCTFDALVTGNAGDKVRDDVTASATDSRGNTITGTDYAEVAITDMQPIIDVLKEVDPSTLNEPGGSATFTVTVTNNSISSDPVTIADDSQRDPVAGLYDSIYGDLNGLGDCTTPQTIAAGGSYSCTFTAEISGNAGYSETDTVTASGNDDDGNPVSDSDSATVTVLDVESNISLIKTASPTSLDEPGGRATFTITVNNLSTVDSVTINSLDDTIFGDLTSKGDCATKIVGQTIAPGGSATCMFSENLQGQPSSPHVNKATAQGTDDDGNPVMAMDDATVSFNNVIPDADLTKDATSAVVTYQVTVTNKSDAEALTLDALVDNQFGDVADVANPSILDTTCVTPQTLESSGQTGDTYNCWFKATVDCSQHTNTLTGNVNDNDGSTTINASDNATVTLTGAADCTP
jgi:uncharacterized repeat protein (TIGR01451 family)